MSANKAFVTCGNAVSDRLTGRLRHASLPPGQRSDGRGLPAKEDPTAAYPPPEGRRYSCTPPATTQAIQSDAAKKRWLPSPPNSVGKPPTQPAKAAGRKYRDQLPPGLDHDEVERRVDEYIRHRNA